MSWLESPIKTEEDFINFVEDLRKDLQTNPDAWVNLDLDTFLDALAAHMKALKGDPSIFSQGAQQEPSWQTFADILYAAKIYE